MCSCRSIGIKGVILAGAGIHLALGLSRLLAGHRRPSRPAAVAMAVGVAVFGLTLFVVQLDPLRMTSGVYRTGMATLPEGAAVTYLRDGKTATISLVEKAGRSRSRPTASRTRHPDGPGGAFAR